MQEKNEFSTGSYSKGHVRKGKSLKGKKKSVEYRRGKSEEKKRRRTRRVLECTYLTKQLG